jgi:hypothetical protein
MSNFGICRHNLLKILLIDHMKRWVGNVALIGVMNKAFLSVGKPEGNTPLRALGRDRMKN